MEPVLFRVTISRWITEGWNTFLRDTGTFALVGIFSTIILTVPSYLLWGPVLTAMIYFCNRFLEGRGVTLKDYFDGYRTFLPALLSSFIIMLLSGVGLILLVVPGLVIFAMYLPTFAVLASGSNDFWQAMRDSRRVASRDYFGFTLFLLALLGLNLLGALFFYIGLIFTLPVSACAITLAYRDAVGLPSPTVDPVTTSPVVIP